MDPFITYLIVGGSIGGSFILLILILLYQEYQRSQKHLIIQPYTNFWGEQSVHIQIPQHIFPPLAKLKWYDELFFMPQHGYFQGTYNGYKLHYRCNLPALQNGNKKPNIKGIIIWQHGIHGQSGYGMQRSDGTYTCMAMRTRMFTKAGYAVYAMDQLGHGYSEGERFLIPNGNYKINVNDFIEFAKLIAQKHDPTIPIFFIGDSYGGCIVLHAAKKVQESPEILPNFHGILLNCPAIIGDLPPPHVVWFLRHVLAPFFPRWTPFFMPHPVNADRIWKEEEPKLYMSDTTQFHGLSNGGQPFCLATACGLLSATEDVREKVIPYLKVPFHINHGSQDYAVPISGSHYLMEKSLTPVADRKFNIVEGGYHDLFAVSDGEKHLQWELNWIESRLDKPFMKMK